MRKGLIGGLTVTVLLALGAVRAADLWRGRDGRLQAEEQRASNLAHILSEYRSEAFAASDAMLRQLALHSQRIGGPSASERDWQPALVSARVGIPAIGSVSVVDRSGIIRHSTRPDIIGQSRADSYLVREAIKAPGDDLIVGGPFRALVEPYIQLIPLARRLTTAAGEIEGAVVAAFIPSEMHRFYGSVEVGVNGRVWVFHRDGAVLFRRPDSQAAIGGPATGNPVFAVAAASANGIVRGPIGDDDRDMISAFQVSDAPHVITAVSLDVDEVLATWRSELRASVLTFAAAGLLVAVTLVVLFRQMDARAAAQAELARARELEAERLRAANDRLAEALDRELHARQEAEAASALKDQFLMTVSHELRTPLTAIAGWSRMLADGMVAEGRRQAAIESIARNAQAQTRLIEDLLDASAIMAGKLGLDLRPVDVVATVRSAVDKARSAAVAKGITLELSCEEAETSIRADPHRLHQVLGHLLSNAIKFTPAGGQVHVDVTNEHDVVTIQVRDTGSGIAPEFRPHVFDQFRQGDASPTRRHGGLGLGLTLVRHLVEMHGGTVVAHSDGVNRGSTFTVRLPSAPARENAGSLSAATPPRSGQTTTDVVA